MSQENAILEYLLAGNSITPLEALNKFGCFRLGARIYDLCQRGFPIDTTMIKVGSKAWIPIGTRNRNSWS